MSSGAIRRQPGPDDGISDGAGLQELEDTVIPLSNIEIKNTKPGLKPLKIADGGGFYVLVTPQGSKLWRLDYRFARRRKTLSIGEFPEVGLADAREQREAARKLLRVDVDPSWTTNKLPCTITRLPVTLSLAPMIRFSLSNSEVSPLKLSAILPSPVQAITRPQVARARTNRKALCQDVGFLEGTQRLLGVQRGQKACNYS